MRRCILQAYYDLDAPKKAVNISLNSDLLRLSKGLDLNLSRLETRVVVPLYLRSAARVAPISRLTPALTFQNRSLVAMVSEMAGLSRSHLGPVLGQLPEMCSEILAALDLLITGF